MKESCLPKTSSSFNHNISLKLSIVKIIYFIHSPEGIMSFVFCFSNVLFCFLKSFFWFMLNIFGEDIRIWWYKYSLGIIFECFFSMLNKTSFSSQKYFSIFWPFSCLKSSIFLDFCDQKEDKQFRLGSKTSYRLVERILL